MYYYGKAWLIMVGHNGKNKRHNPFPIILPDYQYTENIYSRFSFTSEFLENLEEMFPRYYMHNAMCDR